MSLLPLQYLYCPVGDAYMEQHPVPQNVTTFQFRLIGDMTLKQFGYLAGGAILAYVSYKLPLPFIFTYPLAGLWALLGFGLAFVPVEERPMDVWIFSFFKSIYAPTQYIWTREQAAKQPQAQTPPTPTQAEQPTPAAAVVPPAGDAAPIHAAQAAAAAPSDATKSVVAQLFEKRAEAKSHAQAPKMSLPNPITWLTDLVSQLLPAPKHTQPVIRATAPAAAPSIPSVTGTRLNMPSTIQPPPAAAPAPAPTPVPARTPDGLEEKIEQLTQELATKEAGETRILELQKQLTDLLAEKNKMEQELLTMRQRAARPPMAGTSPFPRQPLRPVTPTSSPAAAPQAVAPTPIPHAAPTGPTVKVITQDAAIRSGLPRLTSIPNVVSGITKDNQGNLLPGVLVTVRDKDGVPLRALKTNKLGQFAASTPLPDGTFLVEVEDPRGRFIFDRAQVTLAGAVAPPLEITAKSQKELNRDKLAAELFGKPDM